MRIPEDSQRFAELFERAARPTLAAVERDMKRAPARLKSVFEALLEVLFQRKLTLDDVLAAMRTSEDASIWAVFRDFIGQPPWSYVREYRMEVAARLFVRTSLKVEHVGLLVGYENTSAFRKSFASFVGAAPALYRRRARRRLRGAGVPPAEVDDQAFWERVLAGDLSDEEALELDGYVGGNLPFESSELPSALEEALPWIKTRAEMATAIVADLEGLPWPQQRTLIRDAAWFPDASLFNVLSSLGAHVGKKDPRRGVELAMLGIDSLASNGLLGVHPAIAVLGWTRVARARWRADDLSGTEEALKQVSRDLERAPPEERTASFETERSRLEAAWGWFQGRHKGLRALVDDAVHQERQAGHGWLGHTLLLRAEVRLSMDLARPPEGRGKGVPTPRRRSRLRAVFDDLEEVRGLAHPDWDWQWKVVFDAWSLALVRLGDRSEMARALPQLRRLATELPSLPAEWAEPRLHWLEGWAQRQPERLWQAVLGFMRLEDGLWMARATLDLLRHVLIRRRPETPADLDATTLNVTTRDTTTLDPTATDPLALTSQLAKTLGVVARNAESLAMAGALKDAVAARHVGRGLLDATELVLGRLDAKQRARQAFRFVDE